MKITNTLRTLVAACAFAAASQAGAAVLQVNSAGILTGATGVTVGTQTYDVTFADGSCNAIFNNCSPSAFAFSTLADARLAANALLYHVFIDGPLGNFDSTTNNIFGCTATNICQSIIPYSLTTNSSAVNVIHSVNRSGASLDTISINYSTSFSSDSTNNLSYNFAVFTLAKPISAVPEPSSIALFGLAMAGLAFSRRRKA